MQRSSHLSVTRSFNSCHEPSSFSADARRAARCSKLPIIVALLISCGIGLAERVHAEPAVVQQSANAPAANAYADFIREAAQRFGIPVSWISAVMAMESGGAVLAMSPRGAMGLMQIMPETWAGLRARLGLGVDPYEPRDNILAGAAYLRELHDRYGSPGFLAAYNAGPARYDEYLATGKDLPVETQLYVAQLAPLVGAGQVNDGVTVKRWPVSWQDSPLFVQSQRTPAAMLASFRLLPDRTSVGASAGSSVVLAPQADGLFVHRPNAK